MRTTGTLTISLPPAMVNQMEMVRKLEHRTRSELLREAWRHYFESRFSEVAVSKKELAAIRRGRAAFRRGEYVSLAQLLDDLDSTNHQTRAKKSSRVAGKRARAR